MSCRTACSADIIHGRFGASRSRVYFECMVSLECIGQTEWSFHQIWFLVVGDEFSDRRRWCFSFHSRAICIKVVCHRFIVYTMWLWLFRIVSLIGTGRPAEETIYNIIHKQLFERSSFWFHRNCDFFSGPIISSRVILHCLPPPK